MKIITYSAIGILLLTVVVFAGELSYEGTHSGHGETTLGDDVPHKNTIIKILGTQEQVCVKGAYQFCPQPSGSD